MKHTIYVVYSKTTQKLDGKLASVISSHNWQFGFLIVIYLNVSDLFLIISNNATLHLITANLFLLVEFFLMLQFKIFD